MQARTVSRFLDAEFGQAPGVRRPDAARTRIPPEVDLYITQLFVLKCGDSRVFLTSDISFGGELERRRVAAVPWCAQSPCEVAEDGGPAINVIAAREGQSANEGVKGM